MSWKDDDNTKKRGIDKNFVSCDERDGKEKNKFEEYEKKYGKKAVDHCCKEVKGNKPRKEFEDCLEKFKKIVIKIKKS